MPSVRGRVILVGMLVLVCLLQGQALAWAGEAPSPPKPEAMAEQQFGLLDGSEVQRVLERVNRETTPYVQPLEWRGLMGYLKQGRFWDPARWLRGLLRFFLAEVLANLQLLGRLIVLALLSVVLQQLRARFAGEAVGRIAQMVVFLVLATLALEGFLVALRVATGAVSELRDFMLALLPLLLSLLAAGGALVSAGLVNPLLMVTVHAVSLLTANWVLPLLFLAAVIELVGRFQDGFPLSNLAGLLRQSGLVLLGLSLTLFLGVSAVQGLAGTVADSVGLRTAKYLASALVPVVGKMFSDSAELVASSTLLLRGGVGVLGLVAVLTIVAFPLVKLISMLIVYRVAAAVVQPLGGAEVGDVLTGIAGTISLVAVALGAVALMFFLAITALVGIGNATVMLR